MCLDCASGFHELCIKGGCESCHAILEAQTLEDLALESTGFRAVTGDELTSDGRHVKRRTSDRTKNDLTLKDPHSTGRKRAVTLHGHANPSEPCEWRGMANCGGGRFPILGCDAGFQENLHHGPDKNTLNNDRSNIHKICSQCHNRWHTLNDIEYEWDGHHEAHSPRDVEKTDLIEDARRWENKQVKRAPKE